MQEIKITVPTNLNDIPLDTYLKWVKAAKDLSNEDADNLALFLFAGLSNDTSRAMVAQDRQGLLGRIYTALNTNPPFCQTFTFEGITYGFEPNFDEISFGQFVDLDSIKDYEAEMPKVMAILYRPVLKSVGNTYTIESYGNTAIRARLFERMPAGIVLGAMLFFWTIGKNCLSDTLNYTEKAAQPKRFFSKWAKSGAGTPTSITSAKETSEELKTLLKSLITPYYFGLPLRPTWQLQIIKHHELLPRN
jgi:hypothetical protein